MNIFETIDKTGRTIRLSLERYQHIQKRPEMHDSLNEIEETLRSPARIITSLIDEDARYYLRHFKGRPRTARHLKVVVKYLNGHGYIITAYYTKTLQ